MKLCITLFYLTILWPVLLFSQEKPTISGGVNANSTFYSATGIQARRDPLYWMFSGNIGVAYRGVSLPFSATFSQQQRSFTQPFNQFGASPKYKSLTLHAGYRSLNFSEFTYAGTVFLGGGLEVAPSRLPVKVAALYGRISRPVNVGGVDGVVSGLPAYERWAYGAKVTLFNSKHSLDLILFKAWDKANSINQSYADTAGIKPQDNLVLGANIVNKLGSRLSSNIEVAWSALNTDTRASLSQENIAANNLGFLFTQRQSSQFNVAGQASLAYSADRYQIGAKYRRISPQFRTLGSTFLANDLEDISGNLAWKMLKSKVNIALSGGFQQNNLDNNQLTRLTRVIGSANVTYAVTPQLNLTANAANFNSTTQLTQFVQKSPTQQLNADSLFYLQVTNNAGLGINYAIKGSARQHTISANGSWQEARDNKTAKTTFYTINLGYQTSWQPRNLSANTALNLSKNETGSAQNMSLGPVFGISKALFKKKVKLSTNFTVLNTYNNNNLTNTSISARTGLGFTLPKKHSLSADITFLNNQGHVANGRTFSELRFGVNYGWNFSR